MQRVPSAKSPSIRLLVGMTVFVTIGSVLLVPGPARWVGLAAALPVVAFVLWIYFGTYYELRETVLYCRSGPFVEKIPYARIRSIRLCRNLLSSMALSSKRIEIRQYGKGTFSGTTMISPVDREWFMQELEKHCVNREESEEK